MEQYWQALKRQPSAGLYYEAAAYAHRISDARALERMVSVDICYAGALPPPWPTIATCDGL